MTKRIFSRAAQRADQIIATIADHLSGNKARRAALHRKARSIANDIRQRKLEEKREIANQILGSIPSGHRAMLKWRAELHHNAV